ncbi:hypothetical protein BCF59_0518 [Mycoplasmopsis mustelae]|uniref:Uncharacterized protein n=1 Tax=Mycoplasmopsis mustelae TaxID=171289 RepID=A0A4R7UCB7_9BACT|nr:hypothetical protein [Mycoplasmopsis mustelae]TDV23528.1 hypothetical protein BCF59_0518 [Mycoplasmopsis mustelae]
MKKIRIKTVSARNFKGLSVFNFSDNGTNLQTYNTGANASGKTTSLDIIPFLLNNKKNLTGNLSSPQYFKNMRASLMLQIDKTNYEITTHESLTEFCINKIGRKPQEIKEQMQTLMNVGDADFEAMFVPVTFLNAGPTVLKNYFIRKYLRNAENLKKIWLIFRDRMLTKQDINIINSDELDALLSVFYNLLKVSEPSKVNNIDTAEIRKIFRANLKRESEHEQRTRIKINTLKDLLNDKDPNINELMQQYTSEITQFLKDIAIWNTSLWMLDIFEALVVEQLNELIKTQHFYFDFSFIPTQKTDELLIRYKGVEFKSLNKAERVLVGVELAKFLQTQSNIMGFILIDDAEHLDNYSKQRLQELAQGFQVLITTVSNSDATH